MTSTESASASIPPPVISDLEFCPWCGSILPLISLCNPVVKCQRCQYKRNVEDYQDAVEEFTIYFNSNKKKKDRRQDQNSKPISESQFSGPTVERQCPKCRADIMTYTTRQTRSADEGQTVFYTCIQCKFQDIEYS